MHGRLAHALLIVLLGAATWVPTADSEVADSGVRGVVLDTTCYGPCQVDQHPEPYQGGQLIVRIRRVSTGELVRSLSPVAGRFATHLRPGGYRVIARIRDECWEGETKRIAVKAQELTRVVLHVGNRCIV